MTELALAAHEKRVCRRLAARGEAGLGEALCRLDGTVAGGRYRIESLYAVGSEGAVYLARDLAEPGSALRIAKIALLPLHRPFDLSEEEIRRRRDCMREEADNLSQAQSQYMPRHLGLYACENPSLEREWGGEFAAAEPVLVMEKIPGFDLDLWLARMHSSRVPKNLLRRQLDHVAVVVLTGLMDLAERGFYYTDLRPGNVRIRGRSRDRVRLMDAGSLVRSDDRSGKFPHVPAYLPAELFDAFRSGKPLLPSPAVQAVMAGRTLYEVATGRVPLPGEPVDTSCLYGLNVSPSIAETIDRLCRGAFPDVIDALAYLAQNYRPAADEERPLQPAPKQAHAAPKSAFERLARAEKAAEKNPVRTGPGSVMNDRVRVSPRGVAPAASSVAPVARPVLDLHSALAAARTDRAPTGSSVLNAMGQSQIGVPAAPRSATPPAAAPQRAVPAQPAPAPKTARPAPVLPHAPAAAAVPAPVASPRAAAPAPVSRPVHVPSPAPARAPAPASQPIRPAAQAPLPPAAAPAPVPVHEREPITAQPISEEYIPPPEPPKGPTTRRKIDVPLPLAQAMAAGVSQLRPDMHRNSRTNTSEVRRPSVVVEEIPAQPEPPPQRRAPQVTPKPAPKAPDPSECATIDIPRADMNPDSASGTVTMEGPDTEGILPEPEAQPWWQRLLDGVSRLFARR